MRVSTASLLVVLLGLVHATAPAAPAEGQMVEITAASDDTFHVAHEKSPVIRTHPGELLHLHVTAQKGAFVASDGAVHGIFIRSLRDEGWDIRLYEGTHVYDVKAPAVPGEYSMECTVLCGSGHEDMHMKLLVED